MRPHSLASIILEKATDILNEPPGSDAEEKHIVDDEELLYRWTLGDLTDEERTRLLDHLAVCGDCRREVAAMLREGVLNLPDVPEVRDTAAPRSLSATQPPPGRGLPRWLVWAALSVCLLCVLGVVAFQLSLIPGLENRQLAQAKQALQAGDSATAYHVLVQALEGQRLSAKDRDKAKELLIRAGTELARNALRAGNSSTVEAIAAKVFSLAEQTPELVNISLQARRGEKIELSLLAALSLRDYGYGEGGFPVCRALAPPDSNTLALGEAFERALARHPHSLELRLNYGFYHLSLGEMDEAIRQFTKATEMAPDNPLTHTALGLALFQREDPANLEEAFKHFQKALSLDPGNPAFLENVIICEERLKEEMERLKD